MNEQELQQTAKEIIEICDADWTESEDFMDLVDSYIDSEDKWTEEEKEKLYDICFKLA